MWQAVINTFKRICGIGLAFLVVGLVCCFFFA